MSCNENSFLAVEIQVLMEIPLGNMDVRETDNHKAVSYARHTVAA